MLAGFDRVSISAERRPKLALRQPEYGVARYGAQRFVTITHGKHAVAANEKTRLDESKRAQLA